jgi:hypothetical protein
MSAWGGDRLSLAAVARVRWAAGPPGSGVPATVPFDRNNRQRIATYKP